MKRQILHIDVNNAFLSWTAINKLNNGEKVDIRNIPAVIGGDEESRHGIVLAKSPIAKQFGIKTAEPIYFAKQKCPNLQVFQADFQIYKKYSDCMYNLFLDYTEKVERFSIDECFLDMTGYVPKGRSLLDMGKEINQKIKETFGFTVNVGVANNKLLAKMASDFEKPDKIHTLFEEEIEEKMWPLPVSELFGVGRKSAPKLEKLGIKTIGDLAKYDKDILRAKFGKFGIESWNHANGIDYSEVYYREYRPKGIGNSTTVPKDLKTLEEVENVLFKLVDEVTYRLREQKMKALVVNVQLRNTNFENYSHQKKLDFPTDSTKIINEEAKKLVKELYKNEPIRLVGVRVDNLYEKEESQISLFDMKDDKQEKIDSIVDDLKSKYGFDNIKRAGLINNK